MSREKREGEKGRVGDDLSVVVTVWYDQMISRGEVAQVLKRGMRGSSVS